jgi:hypothetical protein
MNPRRPLLSLGLDLDNLWSYMKIHGDAGWDLYPTYLEKFSSILLKVMARHRLRLTIFVVGQDAALRKNAEALGALASAGHEIGNHSFRHEPWFQLYTRAEIEDEISRAEESIQSATGRRPIGFRGPGYSLSPDTLRVLSTRGYLYDCSTLPTFLGPLARAYYFWNTRGMSESEREKRKNLYGSMRDGLRPLRPYAWSVDGRKLIELPVTTMPLFRVPFHMSYLLYLSRFSRAAALGYFRISLILCRLARITPSFLLHPLDFLGCDEVRELAFFPGMNVETQAKIDFVDEVLEGLTSAFEVVTLEEHARAVETSFEPTVRRLSQEWALG